MVELDHAEARARELMRSVVSAGDFALYEHLGFISVAGRHSGYAWLVYPYRPLIAYDPASGELLSEFCIRFSDGDERLPPADDVLARWMTLKSSERELIAESNVNPPGTQVDPAQARRDIERLRHLRAAI